MAQLQPSESKNSYLIMNLLLYFEISIIMIN